MQVQRTGSNPTFTNGVYFSKASNICFDKTATFVNQSGMKVSENGYKYIENSTIPKQIKDKFLNNEFIKKISEKFDTFIWFDQVPANKKWGNGYIAMAKIWWADPSKNAAQSKGFRGVSKSTSARAVDNMFKELKTFEKNA